ncbi:MAG: acetate kinase [Spirochaetales bacterium]|nr:acetate kinase [Spirochaetales bacterium]
MIILTLNCGSSSVKYRVFDWQQKAILATGIVERVGMPGSFIEHYSKGKEKVNRRHDCPNHRVAIALITKMLLDKEQGALPDLNAIKAVGHRVVHGAEIFSKSIIIDDKALNIFKDVADLSPLHNPANIMGIEAAREVLPAVPHCAIMDTAWHQTMPKHAFIYALPYEWYEQYHVRRYGFHGTSLLYVAKRAAVLLDKKPAACNLITLHIGNGVSANAVKNGISVDTSMGLTPLEGLVMGTRSGDIDPAICFYIMRKTGIAQEEMETILNKKSGVLGITRKYIDRRDVVKAAEQGDDLAKLAIEIEVYRLRKYIGAYYAALGRVDALIFTAGVGEMSPLYRAKTVAGLEDLGVVMDFEKNKLSQTRNVETDITGKNSKVKVFVIPTDEEIVMTEDTYALLQGIYDVHTEFEYSFQKKSYVNLSRAEALKSELIKNPKLKDIIALSP